MVVRYEYHVNYYKHEEDGNDSFFSVSSIDIDKD